MENVNEAVEQAEKAEQEQREAEQAGASMATLHSATVKNTSSFVAVIEAINNDKAGGDYTITLEGNFSANAVSFAGNAAKTITIKGDGTARAISNDGSKALFRIPKGITLVLEKGLILDGKCKRASLVIVDGGTLVMNSGSTVRGAKVNGVCVYKNGIFVMAGGRVSRNTSSYNCGGVYVYNGTFTMKGGSISGNIANGNGGGVFVADKGTFIMEGGAISDNTASFAGGGVLVWKNGTFIMEGGAISGNTASLAGGGALVYGSGTFVKSGRSTIDAANKADQGRAVYVYDSTARVRNSAAGPGLNLDSRVEGSEGGWEAGAPAS